MNIPGLHGSGSCVACLQDRFDAAFDSFAHLHLPASTQQQGIADVVTAPPEQNP
jgi:hypothetical protein